MNFFPRGLATFLGWEGLHSLAAQVIRYWHCLPKGTVADQFSVRFMRSEMSFHFLWVAVERSLQS
jgi:hypothetical protein